MRVPSPLRLWLPVVLWAGLIFAPLVGTRSRHRPGHAGISSCASSRTLPSTPCSARCSCGRSGRPVPAFAARSRVRGLGRAAPALRPGPARRAARRPHRRGRRRGRRTRVAALRPAGHRSEGRDRPRRARRHAAALARLARRRLPVCSTSTACPEDRAAAAAELDARGARQLASAARALRRRPRARLPAAGRRRERRPAQPPGGRGRDRRLHGRARRARARRAATARRLPPRRPARARSQPPADVVVTTREELLRLRRSA